MKNGEVRITLPKDVLRRIVVQNRLRKASLNIGRMADMVFDSRINGEANILQFEYYEKLFKEDVAKCVEAGMRFEFVPRIRVSRLERFLRWLL